MKRLTIILVVYLTFLLSCDSYKQEFFKTVKGTVTEVRGDDIILNNGITYSCSYNKVKVGDSIQITYFYSERNQKNNIDKLEKL